MNPIVLVLVLVLETKGTDRGRGARGGGSWEAHVRFFACIGTMNRCASQRRGPDRGSATRSLPGSWVSTIPRSRIGAMNIPSPGLRPPSPPRRGEGRG